jgi:hypothetical protein
MAFVIKDRVRETATTTGIGAFTLGGAPGGYQPFSSVMTVGDTCWYGIVLPGSAWETGIGTYTSASTLTRTTVLESSNGGAAVSFGAGSKDVFICQPASQAQARFPTGTVMLFQQTAAPIYWTKQTTHNDKALRVVSGAASSGGTNAFSAVMNTTVSVGNTTITQSTMASHTHTVAIENANAVGNTVIPPGSNPVGSLGNMNTGSIGGDAAHNHTVNFNVAYVDLILASKD